MFHAAIIENRRHLDGTGLSSAIRDRRAGY
jgi:hypothetical protein